MLPTHSSTQKDMFLRTTLISAETSHQGGENEKKENGFYEGKFKLKDIETIFEKGASNWLNAMTLKEHNFYLNKYFGTRCI